MRGNKWVTLTAVLLGGLVLLNPAWTSLGEPLAAANIQPAGTVSNQPAPAFALQGLDGKSYHVGGVRDKPLIINFWASWCGPCHEEAPSLKRIYDKYNHELDIYAVNVTKEDSLKEVKAFVGQYALPFPVLLDTKGGTADSYRILFVPTSFIVNKKGVIVDVFHVLPAQELENKIQMLLNEDKKAT